MSGLTLLRRSAPSGLEAILYEPILCLILEGAKRVWSGEQTISFGPGECLLVSHALPVNSRVTAAPYLALVFKVDLSQIESFCEEGLVPAQDTQGARAMATHSADPGLLDALCRYLTLADSPADAQALAPLVSKEIHYRLLVAPFGAMLRGLVCKDSSASAITRAIGDIRRDIRATIAIPDLARQVGMSASSFHKHFKTITSRTPLQYQKELRLLEARRLLTTTATSVTTAAYDVGYESSSQFSREYARQFGISPSQEKANATRQPPNLQR